MPQLGIDELIIVLVVLAVLAMMIVLLPRIIADFIRSIKKHL